MSSSAPGASRRSMGTPNPGHAWCLGKEAPERQELRGVAKGHHADHQHSRERYLPAAPKAECSADRDPGKRRDPRENIATLFGDDRAPAGGIEEGRLHGYQDGYRKQRNDR